MSIVHIVDNNNNNMLTTIKVGSPLDMNIALKCKNQTKSNVNSYC